MVSIIEERIIGNKRLIKAVALAGDTKPTDDDLANGSVCIIMDGGTKYYYDQAGETWVEYAVPAGD